MTGVVLHATLFLLVLLAGAGVMSVAAYVPDGYTPLGPGDTYLALGDSLPLGYEVPANADDDPGYAVRLNTFLQTDNPGLTTYENLAVVGETSTSMITSTEAISSQLELAVAFIESERADGRNVGLVTLSIGGNDMLRILPAAVGGEGLAGEVALAEFSANLDIILDTLLGALTVGEQRQGDLLLMNYYNPYPGLENPLDPGNNTDTWLPQFNAVIQAAAEARGLPMAEVAQAFEGNEAMLIYVQRPYADLLPPPPNVDELFDFHPRPAGHCVLAREFYAVSGYGDMSDFQTCLQSVFLPAVLK
jgi:lysophospholipase L1-like esterase